MYGNSFFASVLVFSLISVSAGRAQGPAIQPSAEAPATFALASEKTGDSGFYVFGESLYVWPHRDNLQTAILSNNVESLSWSGTPGLRVGGGYRLLDTGWDVGASFVYFHAKSQRTVSATDGSTLLPVLTTNPAARNPGDADGDAGLSYSVLDLDIGRSFHIDDSFTLRLLGGIRLASIGQSLKCIYSGGMLGDNFDFVNSPVRFQGAGLTAGAESNWEFYQGWGFYGRARLGLIASRFTSQRTETLGSVTVSDINDSFDTIVPVAEMGIGLRYQGRHFFFSAGYELSNWFNMVNGLGPDVVAGQASRRQGSLTLEALTLRLGYAF